MLAIIGFGLCVIVIAYLLRHLKKLQDRTEGLVVHILDVEKENAELQGKVEANAAAQLVWASTGNCAQACLNYQALEKGHDENIDNYEQQWLSHNEAIANLSTKLSFAEQDLDVLYGLASRLAGQVVKHEEVEYTEDERDLLDYLKLTKVSAEDG